MLPIFKAAAIKEYGGIPFNIKYWIAKNSEIISLLV